MSTRGGSNTPTVTKKTVNQPAGPSSGKPTSAQHAATIQRVLNRATPQRSTSKKGRR